MHVGLTSSIEVTGFISVASFHVIPRPIFFATFIPCNFAQTQVDTNVSQTQELSTFADLNALMQTYQMV